MGLGSWYNRYTSPTTLLGIAFLILLSLLAVLYADSYMPAITEWYLQMTVTPELIS